MPPASRIAFATPNLAVQAARLEARINREARLCRTDPVRSRRLGVAPQADMDLFAPLVSPATPPHPLAAWLRGAAAALLPVGWRYQILPSPAGGVALHVTAFDPPRPEQRPSGGSQRWQREFGLRR